MPTITVKLPLQSEFKSDGTLKDTSLHVLLSQLHSVTDSLINELNDVLQNIYESAIYTFITTGSNVYECLKNACDADATEISVSIEIKDDTVFCDIVDNGKGFSTDSMFLNGNNVRNYREVLNQSNSSSLMGGISNKLRDGSQLGGNGLGLKFCCDSIEEDTCGKGTFTIGNKHDASGQICGAQISITSPRQLQDHRRRRNSYHEILAGFSSSFNEVPDNESTKTAEDILNAISHKMKRKQDEKVIDTNTPVLTSPVPQIPRANSCRSIEGFMFFNQNYISSNIARPCSEPIEKGYLTSRVAHNYQC